VGHVVLFASGYLGSLFFPREQSSLTEMTLWKWLKVRKDHPAGELTPAPQR
jgi:hypothetical protein